jgi:hypothetical protein
MADKILGVPSGFSDLLRSGGINPEEPVCDDPAKLEPYLCPVCINLFLPATTFEKNEKISLSAWGRVGHECRAFTGSSGALREHGQYHSPAARNALHLPAIEAPRGTCGTCLRQRDRQRDRVMNGVE